jgi:hypothetical protein
VKYNFLPDSGLTLPATLAMQAIAFYQQATFPYQLPMWGECWLIG